MSAPASRRLELPLSPPPAGQPPCAEAGWRADFPIDWPQDHFVARRDFTKLLTLTSVPFALMQLGLAVSNWLRRSRGRPPVHAVARLEDVPVGGSVGFSYPTGGDPCLLVRPDERTVLAYSQKCTHLGCPVAPEVGQGRLYCPCHHASFDLATGRPLAGPPRRPLPRIALENRKGVLYAVGVETGAA
jgi:nitrite reductase/ring-hydroxylating ferredoxin subunit